MKKYSFKLQHDKGTVNITVVCTSLQAAIKAVTSMELAPESSIMEIKITKQ